MAIPLVLTLVAAGLIGQAPEAPGNRAAASQDYGGDEPERAAAG
jgi:hypothetical protein